MAINKELWGTAPDGKEIFLYTLKNASGAYVQLCSVGAGIVSIVVPDKEGKLADVVLGYKTAQDYFADAPCAGKISEEIGDIIRVEATSIIAGML